MKKTEAKAIAKDTLLTAISVAYYRICDDNDYTEEEQNLIIDYINKYGETMAKSINEKYFTQ
jgi:hypothetical protein